jgi:hypothetical protein
LAVPARASHTAEADRASLICVHAPSDIGGVSVGSDADSLMQISNTNGLLEKDQCRSSRQFTYPA